VPLLEGSYYNNLMYAAKGNYGLQHVGDYDAYAEYSDIKSQVPSYDLEDISPVHLDSGKTSRNSYIQVIRALSFLNAGNSFYFEMHMMCSYIWL